MPNEENNRETNSPAPAVEANRTSADPDRPASSTPQDQNGKPAADQKASPKKGKAWYRNPPVVGLVMLIVIGAAVAGALWWRHSRHYQSTEDAFVDIVSQRVSPQVAGRVLRVLVDDNQDVAAGAVLVEIDPADFQNRLEQAHSSAAQAEAQIAEAEAQSAVTDAQTEQARANEGVAEANATNAANDLRRFRDLKAENTGAVSQQQLDRVEAAATSGAAQLRAAQKGVVAAEALTAHAAKQIDAARAAAKSAAAQVAQAELTLSYTQIKASVAGRIARKTVAPGNIVQPGADLMAVVPPTVYVTANFKETQLALMRPGQPVKIEVDSYPDLQINGHVDSVQPATGQAFDLLPSQNAAGNWVKVVQRVPVKIVLDQIPTDSFRRLAPGMSVTATVTVR